MADEIEFPVEAGHILMFQRAIGEADPRTDLAPPTFVQASAQFDPDYPLRPKVGEPWFGSGGTPTGATKSPVSGGDGDGGGGGGGTGLHAEQRYEYHRPVRAGDVLTAMTRPGNKWTKTGRRGGTLNFVEQVTEYRDQAGELVVTATSVGVITERVVEQSEQEGS
jgi:N-terminal half of MaoC dehydratase